MEYYKYIYSHFEEYFINFVCTTVKWRKFESSFGEWKIYGILTMQYIKNCCKEKREHTKRNGNGWRMWKSCRRFSLNYNDFFRFGVKGIRSLCCCHSRRKFISIFDIFLQKGEKSKLICYVILCIWHQYSLQIILLNIVLSCFDFLKTSIWNFYNLHITVLKLARS